MPFGVIFAWDARRHAPAPSLINANRPSCRVCRLQRRRSALEAPCPLVCLVCRPGGRPTFSCDPEAHAVHERPSSASAHAPGGASLYNGEMARFLGLSSAGDVSVLGRPASVMRARRTACTYPSAANPHTACCRLRIYMEGNARIYVNGQLPGPPSVHLPPLLIRGTADTSDLPPSRPLLSLSFCWLLSVSASTMLPGVEIAAS